MGVPPQKIVVELALVLVVGRSVFTVHRSRFRVQRRQ